MIRLPPLQSDSFLSLPTRAPLEGKEDVGTCRYTYADYIGLLKLRRSFILICAPDPLQLQPAIIAEARLVQCFIELRDAERMTAAEGGKAGDKQASSSFNRHKT